MPGDSLKFSVNISPVTYPQDNNLTAFKIEDNSIISDSESISSKLRVSKYFSISVRVLLISEKGFPYTFFNFGWKLLDIFVSPVGLYEVEPHRPKTSSCDFIVPAL